MQTNSINQTSVPTNQIFHGDCISVMQSLPTDSIDFILTDPPYLVRYQDREGRSIQNDSNSDWLEPAFKECHRVLKPNHFMVSFYGWTQVDKFFAAWRSAGFCIVGHLVFRKPYTSKSRFLKYQHEQAYLLAKGNPPMPENPIADVIDMPYSGNKLHLQIGDVVTGLMSPSLEHFELGDGCAIAMSVGQVSATVYGGATVTLNISKTDYVGMYQYRYLEEP